MNIPSYYITNIVGIAILLVLAFAAHTRTLRHHTEDKVYSAIILGVMLGCAMEILSYIIDGKMFPGARILNYATNTYLFTANLVLPFGIIVYVDLFLYDDIKRIWKCYKVQIIIGLVMILANIVNYFVPIVFYVDENNIYERRLFSYFYYAVIVFYFVTAIILLRRFERENGARAFLNFSIFLIPVLVGSGLQFAFYGLSVAWLSSSVGLVGLFMMEQNEMAYIDSLVNTFNRQYLDQILHLWIRRNRAFYGIMIDIDNFKNINDEYGHSEGDLVLKALSEVLKKSAKDKELVFRFAGDEFIVLKNTTCEDDLKNYMNEVLSKIDDYNKKNDCYQLSISYGISKYEKSSIDIFMKEIDRKMYEMKVEHHLENC